MADDGDEEEKDDEDNFNSDTDLQIPNSQLSPVVGSANHIQKEKEAKQQINAILKQITTYFEVCDKLQEKISSSISNEFLKNFKKLIRKNNKNNIEMLETPIFVLKQRCNYLKGKTALLCKDFQKALKYFYLSESVFYIGDAKIVRKSTKKILSILQMTKLKIEQLTIKDSKKVNALKFSEQKKENLTILSKEMDFWEKKFNKLHLSNTLLSLGNFDRNKRDIIILINSKMNIEKKMDKAIKLSIFIYKTLITAEDKFGLFLFGQNLNPIVKLEKKTHLTYQYVKNEIMNLEKNLRNSGLELGEKVVKVGKDDISYIVEKDCNVGICTDISLKSSILKVCNYLMQKSNIFLIIF